MKYLCTLGSLMLTLNCVATESEPVTKEVLLKPHFTLKNAYNVTFSGTALYWTADEEGLDYVITNTPGLSIINNDGVVKRGMFDWNWGFRVGAAYQVPNQKMDLSVAWTRYFTHGLDRVDSNLPPAIFSVWTSALANVSNQRHATMRSDLHFNMIDLRMGASFSPREFLDLTPFVDACAVWVNQDFNIDVFGGNDNNSFGSTILGDQINMTNRFWGVGPKVGLDTLWVFGYGISFYGNFDLSLLYGKFRITQNETSTTEGVSPSTVFLDIVQNEYFLSRFNFDLAVGLRWTHLFANDSRQISLEAGWEQLILFGQNQLMRFFSSSIASTPASNSSGKGDLVLQGLTMRAGFVF